MKAIILTQRFDHPSSKYMSFGHRPMVYKLVMSLKQNISIDVIAGCRHKFNNSLIQGVPIDRVFMPLPELFNSYYLPFNLFAYNLLKRKLKKERIDILNSQSSIGGITFKLLKTKIPKVTSLKIFAGGWLKTLKPSFGIGYLHLLAFLKWDLLALANSDYLIVPSKFAKQEIDKFPEDRIQVIYNGTDTELFRPEFNFTLRRNLRFKETDRVILSSSGGGGIRKGADLVVKSFIKLKRDFPDLKLVFFMGVLSEKNKQILNSEGLLSDVRSFNVIPHTNLPQYYNLCDIFVLPSKHETFGSAVAEAMACEKPVVVSNAGALPEVVGNAGLMSDADNLKGFVEHISSLLGDNNKRKKLGKLGRRRVLEKFTIERTARNYIKFFKKII